MQGTRIQTHQSRTTGVDSFKTLPVELLTCIIHELYANSNYVLYDCFLDYDDTDIGSIIKFLETIIGNPGLASHLHTYIMEWRTLHHNATYIDSIDRAEHLFFDAFESGAFSNLIHLDCAAYIDGKETKLVELPSLLVLRYQAHTELDSLYTLLSLLPSVKYLFLQTVRLDDRYPPENQNLMLFHAVPKEICRDIMFLSDCLFTSISALLLGRNIKTVVWDQGWDPYWCPEGDECFSRDDLIPEYEKDQLAVGAPLGEAFGRLTRIAFRISQRGWYPTFMCALLRAMRDVEELEIRFYKGSNAYVPGVIEFLQDNIRTCLRGKESLRTVIIKLHRPFDDDAVPHLTQEILQTCPHVTRLYIGDSDETGAKYPVEITPQTNGFTVRNWWEPEWNVSRQSEGEIIVVGKCCGQSWPEDMNSLDVLC